MKRLLALPILLAALTIASFASVTVTTPTNGATVQSPVKFVASAASYRQITGMVIYVDSTKVYRTSSASLSTSIPMSSGQHAIMVKAWNSQGRVYEDSMTLLVKSGTAPTPTPITALKLATTSLANGAAGSGYSATLQASGGTSPYKWSVASGSLPAGLTLSTAGTISGTPKASGASSFSVSVKDSETTPQTATAALKLTIIAPTPTPITVQALQLTTSSLPGGTKSSSYSANLQASGGTSPYTWSVAAGSLPAGVTLSSNGTISGTPSASGAFSFTVQVKDSESTPQSASKALSISVAAATSSVSPVSITTTSMASATAGSSYSATIAAKGGTSPYTWSIASGQLPTGLKLSTPGVISGTPTTSGSFQFTVDVKDSEATPQLASYSESISVAAAPALSIKAITLSGAKTETVYSATLGATGGIPAYTWSVASGALPTGLTLSSSGAISGTPTASGTFNFTAQVKDSEATPKTATQNESIVVVAASTASTSVTPPSQAAGYNLVFDDEFTTLNISPNREGAYNWYEGIWWNSSISPMSDITDSNGAVTLNWVNGQGTGSTDISGCSQNGSDCHTYRYGYFEASMKWDPTTGAWPAFWLIPVQGITDPTGEHGEIDVFEGQGTDGTYYATIHDWNNNSDVYNNDSSNAHKFASNVDLTQFHTYAVLWVPGTISWYFDNQLLGSAQTDAIFDEQDYYPVFSSQEGINWSEGNTSGVTASTMPLTVDWIHIFQK